VFRAGAVALWLAAVAAAGVAAQGAEPTLRDPMRPFQPVIGEGGPGTAPAPRFRLTAVLISPSRRVAIINGKPYQQGEKIGAAEVTHIDAQSVGLREGELQLVVHLGKTRARAAAVTGDSGQ
jgi:hypothetical protein